MKQYMNNNIYMYMDIQQINSKTNLCHAINNITIYKTRYKINI